MKWPSKFRISQRGQFIIVVLTVLISIAAISKNASDIKCSRITIDLENTHKNYFLNEDDILDILTNEGSLNLIGMSSGSLNLRHLENKVKENPFVKDAEVFMDLRGVLGVKIYQKRPIARLMLNHDEDRYISNEGELLPMSRHYTARVPLIIGEIKGMKNKKNLLESDYGSEFFDLLQFIDKDPFWRAQVAQLNLDRRGNIDILTQVSRQVVEFGHPDNLDSKFKKLMIFYKKILPAKGWNTYEKVNIKYKDQIICE